MDDSTGFERAIFVWFSKHGYRVAAVAPLVVLFVVLAAGIVVVSAIAGSIPSISFVAWIVAIAIVAAVGLYVTALYSFTGVLQDSRRFKLLKLHQTMVEIRAMNWRDFEDLVGGYLEERGFDVEHQGRDTADGGVDLVARR